MKLAPMYYMSGNDTKATMIVIMVRWVGDARLGFVNSRNKLNRLTKPQLLSIYEQLRYTPNPNTHTAIMVFRQYGIAVAPQPTNTQPTNTQGAE